MRDPVNQARRHTLQALGTATATLAVPGIVRAATQTTHDTPVVQTRLGRLQGSAQHGVAVFKGVPYAASTAGANRFLPPQALAPWSGIRMATAFGASAPQTPSPNKAITDWYTHIEPISEDCLFLNVYTASLHSPRKRPVMVWLHGGAWSSCAGTAPGFDGTNLARNGKVVVVTINHRLNVFGYLSLPDLGPAFADAGNAGVLDMGAALHWVKDNIEAFGGDPGNVTIFGQSGGAAKVAALMGAPDMHGLFHKAIIESCSGGLRVRDPDDAARTTAALANMLKINAKDARAWQSVPMAALVAATHASVNSYRPVLDGRTFKAHPFDQAPTPISAGVPLLIGNAATEGTLFLAANPDNFKIEMPQATTRVARFLQISADQAQHIVDAYRTSLSKQASAFHVLAQIVTDYMYRRNTTQIAMLKAQQPTPVYTYVFDWRTPILGGILLSPHTSEVPFVFGTTVQAAGLLGTGADLQPMTHTVVGAWSHFAHTGTPAASTLPRWPRYTDQNTLTMMLRDKSAVVSNPGGQQRRIFDALPFFSYDMPQNFIQA